jgi:hypothetical protein
MGTQDIRIDNSARRGPSASEFTTFHDKEQVTVGWDGTTANLAAALVTKQITGTTYAAGLVTDWVPCDGLSGGMIYVELDAADATTIEAQIEHSPDKTLIAQDHYRGAAGATVTTAPTESQFTVATYTPGSTVAWPIPLELRPGVKYWRLKLKRTGGTSAATTVKVWWVGARQP